MTRLSLALAVLIALAAPASLTARPGAQTPGAGRPSFEVASVKPNKSADARVMVGMQPGGRYTATNVPLRMLIRQAYDVQDSQVVGGPDWIGSDRFDVTAKAPDGESGQSPGELMRLMVQSLLADRFSLVLHTETREMPVYSLVVARSDGRLGKSLTPSVADCTAARGRRGGPPAAPPQPGRRPQCGLMIGIGRMAAGGMRLSELARSLSSQVGRIVLDRTGLDGAYDFELTYAPEQRLPAGALFNGGTEPPPVDPNAPSLFTALQEQLGLKLDSDRGPVEVLVIDRVEQPSPD
jgi:uncharacterized protein (TIGR03435 family)